MPKKDANNKTSFAEIPKRIERKVRTSSEGVLPYDVDNLYPQRVELHVQSSPTAKACADLYAKHIYGKGFEDEAFGETVINEEGETVNELLRQIVGDTRNPGYAIHGGFAIHINYNPLLEAVEFRHVPFKFIRQWDDKNKENEGRYAIYDDWDRVKSKRIEKKNIQWVDKFTTDPEEIASQIAKAQNADGKVTGEFKDWKGHLFYYPDNYPLSPMDSGLADMETDAELALFRNSTVLTSFLASYAVVSKQALEDKTENEIDENIAKVQGGRNAGKVVRISDIGVDNEFEFQKLDTIDSDGLFQITEESSQKNIRKTVLAPRELVGEDFQSGFSNDQVAQMRAYYDSITEDERMDIGRQFAKFIGLFHEPINTLENYRIKPLYEEEEVLDETGAVVEQDVQQLAMNGAQITSLQGLLTAAANGDIPKETAKAAIKAGFPNIPDNLINQMVDGIESKTPQNVT